MRIKVALSRCFCLTRQVTCWLLFGQLKAFSDCTKQVTCNQSYSSGAFLYKWVPVSVSSQKTQLQNSYAYQQSGNWPQVTNKWP